MSNLLPGTYVGFGSDPNDGELDMSVAADLQAQISTLQATLAATINEGKLARGRRPIATIGFLGASTEENNGSASPLDGPFATQAAVNDYGYWGFAQFKLGWQAPRAIRNEGISGNTSAQIRARAAAVFSTGRQPDAWLLGSGLFGNNFGSASIAQSLDDIQAIADMARATGAIVILQTAQPHGPTARIGYTDADYYAMQSQCNAFIRRYALRNACLLNDVERIVSDGLGGWKTGYSGDDLHPYKLGAKMIGYELAALLAPYVASTDNGPSYSADPTNDLGTMGFMAGTLGANVPTGWSVTDHKAAYGESRTATWTNALAARPDGLGNRWTVTLTAPGAVALLAYVPKSYNGQVFDGAVEVDTNGSFAGAAVYDFGAFMQPFALAQTTACLTQQSHATLDFAATPKRTMPDLGQGVLKMPPLQRTDDIANPYIAFCVRLWGETGASISISRARSRQVIS